MRLLKKATKFKKYFVPIFFLLFFCLVYFQHQFLWLYHDDYGYASLSYEYNVASVIGHSYSIGELLSFVIGHYKVWGGRVLYFFIEGLCLSRGLWFFRLVQSIVITFIFYYIYKIISRYFYKKYDVLIAILCVCLYGTIEIMVVRSGLMWATASVLYVFPILPLLMFIYYYEEKCSIFKTLFLMFLIFISSFSQEQISVAAFSYMGLIFIVNSIKNKKICWNDLSLLISSIIGFAILMLSPGSKLRMNHPSNNGFYDLSLFDKLSRSIPGTIYGLFSSYAKMFWVITFLSLLYVVFYNYKNNKLVFFNNKRLLKIFDFCSLFSILLINIFTLFTNQTYFEYFGYMFQNQIINIVLIGVYVIQLLLIVYSLTIYFINNNRIYLLYLSYAAILSQVAMFMSSYYPLRSGLVFQLMFYPIILYVIFDFLKNRKINIKDNVFKISILAIICLSFVNYYTITRGYYRNNYVNKENNQILLEASKDIKSGKKIDKIVLDKLPDILYGGEMPYSDGYDYILYWMYEYYDIPSDVLIVYE